MPAVSPMSSFGATSEITVQPRLVMPWPKNATDMIAMTSASEPVGTKFAMTIVDASNMPPTIGNLRATLADPVCFRIRSEI